MIILGGIFAKNNLRKDSSSQGYALQYQNIWGLQLTENDFTTEL